MNNKAKQLLIIATLVVLCFVCIPCSTTSDLITVDTKKNSPILPSTTDSAQIRNSHFDISITAFRENRRNNIYSLGIKIRLFIGFLFSLMIFIIKKYSNICAVSLPPVNRLWLILCYYWNSSKYKTLPMHS